MQKHNAISTSRSTCFGIKVKHGYENPIFLGDLDSLYAELYSFISAFEILHCLIEQQKIIPQTKFHFLTDSKEARYFLLSIAPPEKTHNLFCLFEILLEKC